MANKDLLYLRIDDREAERLLGELAGKLRKKGKFESIIARAQNAALDTARAETVRVIREEYNAPAGEIKKTMTVKKATKRTLQARLTLKGRMSVELAHYGAKEGRKGVIVKVLKSSRRGPIKPGGDLGIMQTKKNKASATWITKGHVYARVEGKKSPIMMLWGPSFLSRLSADENRDRIMAVATRRFEGTLKHFADQALLQK